MGDVSAEPSMEDILSSIKRIISEEADPQPKARRPGPNSGPRAVPAPPPQVEYEDEDEVLELSEPVPDPAIRTTAIPSTQPAPEPILSRGTADATRSALDALSRLLVKPEPESDGTLEGLVREMLRPMLREWIDANLPHMVETLVAREIAKLTGGLR
jgi:cell pole-organizing protein PopZ